MQSTGNILVVSAIVASLAAVPTGAQSSAGFAATRATPAAIGGPSTGASVSEARQLAENGRLREARGVYKSVIDAKTAAGDYAGEALYGLANIEYALNNPRAAASVLDNLANEASRFGDPEMRLRALFESATLYRDLGEGAKVVERLPQIQTLLKSPVISEQTRLDISGRIKS